MNKKVSLGITVAVCLVAAAIAFSAGFMISRARFNSMLKDLSQKQAMFSMLSDIDSFVRQHYDGKIDESRLHKELQEAVSEALDGEVVFMTADEYKESAYEENGCSYQLLSDGTYMVLTEGVTVDVTDPSTQAASD